MTVRALGYSEACYAHIHIATGAALIRCMTLVAGKINGDHARAAVRSLRLRHPMLDMRIGAARNGFAFLRDGLESPDPVEVRTWDADVDPDAVLAESDHLRFSEADLPYRIVFLLDPTRERNAIVCWSHHALADGRAGFALMEELVALIACALRGDREPAKPDYPVPLPLEQQLVGRPRRARFFAFAAKHLFYELLHPQPRHEVAPSRAVRGAPNACTRMIAVALSTDQSRALRNRAAQVGLSPSDLLTAAVLLAEAGTLERGGLPRRHGRLMLCTPLDYRHLLAPPFRRRKGVFALGTFVNASYHRVSGGDDLIANARETRARIHDPGHRDPERYVFSWFPKAIVRATLSRRIGKSRRFCHGLATTHTGSRRSVDHVPLRLIATFGNVCVRDGNLFASVISCRLNGRLCLSFAYAPPFLSTATADLLVDRFLEVLDLEGSVVRAEGYYGLAQQMRLFDDPSSL